MFHGKSFMPLALLRQPDERCVAIDCFEDQSVNIDRSGEGDGVAFRENVDATMRVCCDGAPDGGGEGDAREDWLAILEMDSTRLADDRRRRAAGSPVRPSASTGATPRRRPRRPARGVERDAEASWS